VPNAVSHEQRLRALALANETRRRMCEIREELRAGTMSLAQALADERAGPDRIGRIVCALPYWGERRTRTLLAMLDISHRRRVRELTEHQRNRLLGAL
jgi:hypothetical protein